VASFLFVLLIVQGCSKAGEEVLLTGPTMGTTYSIKYVDITGAINQAEVGSNVAQLLDYLDGAMSTYQDQSELNRLNDSPVGDPFPVSSMLWQVLLIAEQVFDETKGAFDPTVGPLVDLWGFGPVDTDDRVPTQIEIDALLADVGFNYLKFIPFTQSVEKLRDIRIDLSAIAKGFAAERVADLLVDMGITDFLVEIGGELRGGGVNIAGQPWRIAVEAPALVRGEIKKVISLTDMGVATSGDYRNYFETDGVRYSHTIDPRTGRPIVHNLASVTVVVEDATQADALATGYMVLGQREALLMANHDGVAAFFLVKEQEQFVESNSRALDAYIKTQ